MTTYLDDLEVYKWRDDLHLLQDLRQEGYDFLIEQGIDPATVLIGGIVVKNHDRIRVEVFTPEFFDEHKNIARPVVREDGSIMTTWMMVSELPPLHLLNQVGA